MKKHLLNTTLLIAAAMSLIFSVSAFGYYHFLIKCTFNDHPLRLDLGTETQFCGHPFGPTAQVQGRDNDFPIHARILTWSKITWRGPIPKEGMITVEKMGNGCGGSPNNLEIRVLVQRSMEEDPHPVLTQCLQGNYHTGVLTFAGFNSIQFKDAEGKPPR